VTDHGFHLPERPEHDPPGAHRHEQLASTVRRELERVLARGFSDPRIKGRIAITGVEVTRDLRLAKVRVSVLPPEHADLTMHGLRSAAGYLRNQIKKRIASRVMPRLELQPDESLARQREVYDLLAKAAAERVEADGPDTPAGPEPPTRGDSSDRPANHPEPDGGSTEQPSG